jgi:hypothetical protein
MRATEFLLEATGGIMNILRRELPGWPDYIIKDMVYTTINNQKDLEEKIEHVRWLATQISSWKFYPKMPLTFDMLSQDTQKKMKVDRNFGSKNPFGVVNDEQRSATADTIVGSKGMENLPPVIMVKEADGLDLWEGWHRTMAAFRSHPEGFKINAWIGQK